MTTPAIDRKTMESSDSSLRDDAQDRGCSGLKKAPISTLVGGDNFGLRTACPPLGRVNTRHRGIANRLIDALQAHCGIGIAAPQIGEPFRICVVLRDWKPGLVPVALFDPVIIGWSADEIETQEGCLSFPGEAVTVRRRASVLVQHRTPGGQLVETPFRGIEAVCAQHEIDHLNGIVMHMRAKASA